MSLLQRGPETASNALINRLSKLGTLSDDDKTLLEEAPLTIREIKADHEMASEGGVPAYCAMLIEGFACRYKLASDGQRQIIAFHVPGDLCDLVSIANDRLNHSTVTLTPVRMVPIPYSVILGWGKRSPRLGWLLWRTALLDIAISNEWIVNVGRRIAQRRTAHLLCELVERLRWAGHANNNSYVLPLTQVVLADALGLTAVHVNRTLQWLRSEKLIEFSSGKLTVLNWRELVRTADFISDYLQQSGNNA